MERPDPGAAGHADRRPAHGRLPAHPSCQSSFQSSFQDLDAFQVRLYLTLVLLAAVTTLLVMSAVAVHRRLSGEHAKERVVAAAHKITIAVLTTISLLVTGMVLLILDVVLERAVALLWSGMVGVAALALVVGVPYYLRHEAA